VIECFILRKVGPGTGMVTDLGCWARLLTLTVCAAFLVTTAHARDKRSLREPENKVLAAAVSGEPADFTNMPDMARTIRSWVIENLLTGVYKDRKLNRNGFTIQNAIFDGPLNLGSVDVPVTIRWENCTFKDKVIFSSAHFSAPVFLDRSTFKDLMFNSTRVDDLLDINGITVTGDAQFYHLRVAGDLFGRGDKFTDEKSTIQFSQADVKGMMYFSPYTVDGVKYGLSTFEGSLSLPEAKSPTSNLPHVEMKYGSSTFAGSLSLEDVKALGLDLSGVRIKNTLNLSHADVQTVLNLSVACFDQSQPSCLPDNVELEGLTYEDLDSGARDRLLALINHTEHFSARSYTQLEEYYRTHGDLKKADDVFFDMKRRERRLLKSAFHKSAHQLLPLLWSYLLLGLVHYGRNPEWALGYSFGVIIIGSFIFRRQDMVPQKKDEAPKTYSSFWYSFDLLVPAINLQQADHWMPRQDWHAGRTYVHVHRILGWILVPIGIAAITGIIK
jgi:hypothetical protein